jgi:hypothetical protein
LDSGILNDVRMALFGGYDAGAWFLLPESITCWSEKPARPWILIEPSQDWPTVRMRPRTTSHRGKWRHEPHERRHTDSCRITRPGWIAEVVQTVDADVLPPHYSCAEPDESLVEALRG